MAVTLIASAGGTDTMPGAALDDCGIGDWLRSIQAVREWVADRQRLGLAVNVLAGDRPLPHDLAEDSLTVPTSPSLDRRLRDELDVEET